MPATGCADGTPPWMAILENKWVADVRAGSWMEGDAHDFFSNWQELLPPKTNYRKQPLSTPVLLQDQTTGNNSHVQEGKSQPVRGRGPAPTSPAHTGGLLPAGDRAEGRPAPRGTLVQMRGRDRPKCVSLCIFMSVSGKRQKNPSAGYSQRGERAWGRHFCFSFCISYNKNITKKGRKKKQQTSVGDESSGYQGGRQIPSDLRFSVLLEPDLNLCSEWCGQREGALVGKAEEGWGQGVWERGLGSHLTGHPVLRTVCAACRETANTRKKWGKGPPNQCPAHPMTPPIPWPRDMVGSTHRYRGCSDDSEGDRSGIERDVEDRVVAMEAVVASSKDGGVQGKRSGRPMGRSRWAPVQARHPELLLGGL